MCMDMVKGIIHIISGYKVYFSSSTLLRWQSCLLLFMTSTYLWNLELEKICLQIGVLYANIKNGKKYCKIFFENF